jgi:hypothetical protein
VVLPAPLAAQQGDDVLRGRVVLEAEPVAAVPVTLHRVTAQESGVIATTVSDPSGRFQFRVPPPDSAGFTVYFTTADYLSVRYFGQPIHPGDPREDYALEVFDTASSLPGALRLARRDLVVFPHADGGWEVNEVVRVRNTAERTLVSASAMPTWSISLPAGARDFEVGESDLPADQLRQMGDRLLLLMPLLPGDRELLFRYRIPGDRAEVLLKLDAPADSVNLYIQQPAPHVEVTGLAPREIFEVQGDRFLRFSGADLAADTRVRLAWENSIAPVDPVLAGTGAALALLLVGVGAAFRNRAAGRRGPTALRDAAPTG